MPGPGDDQSDSTEVVRLEAFTGPWADDDPDANFKADVALYASIDPMVTIRTLSQNVGVPAGALVRYVVAKWATGGAVGCWSSAPPWSTGCGSPSNAPRGPAPPRHDSTPTPSSVR